MHASKWQVGTQGLQLFDATGQKLIHSFHYFQMAEWMFTAEHSQLDIVMKEKKKSIAIPPSLKAVDPSWDQGIRHRAQCTLCKRNFVPVNCRLNPYS